MSIFEHVKSLSLTNWIAEHAAHTRKLVSSSEGDYTVLFLRCACGSMFMYDLVDPPMNQQVFARHGWLKD